MHTFAIVTREDSSPKGAIERGNGVVLFPIVNSLRPPFLPSVSHRAILTFSRGCAECRSLLPNAISDVSSHVWITKATKVDGTKLKKHDAPQIPYRGPFLDNDSTSRLCRSLLLPPTKRQRELAERLVLPNRRRRIARGYCFSRIHKVAEIQSFGEVHRMNQGREDTDHEVIKCRYYYVFFRTTFSDKIYILKRYRLL